METTIQYSTRERLTEIRKAFADKSKYSIAESADTTGIIQGYDHVTLTFNEKDEQEVKDILKELGY